MSEPRVECPKCGHRFPVTKALTGQIEESLRHQYEADTKALEKSMKVEYDKRIAAEHEKAEKKAQKQLAADKQHIQRDADKKAIATVATQLAHSSSRQLRASERS